jgi:hypothetical protein
MRKRKGATPENERPGKNKLDDPGGKKRTGAGGTKHAL